jgi:pentatricopeptide repeat protein
MRKWVGRRSMARAMRCALGDGKTSEGLITGSILRGVVVPDRASDGRHVPGPPPCWGLHTRRLHVLVDWAVASGRGRGTGETQRAAAAPPAAAAERGVQLDDDSTELASAMLTDESRPGGLGITIEDFVLKARNAYDTRLTAHAKGGRWEQASAVCAEMSAAGVRPTVATCNALLTAYAKEPHWDRAMDCFLAMKAAGVQPDDVTYNCLIAAYGHGGQWERARAVFGAVKAMGVVPHVSTYNAMLALYNNYRQLHLIWALDEEMCEAEVAFDEVTYNTIITAFGNDGQSEAVRFQLHWMQEEGWTPGGVAYHALINAYGNDITWGEGYGNQWEGALAAFEEMKAAGVQPDVRAYNILMDAYGNGLQWERALAAYDEMKAAGMQPDVGTYNVLMDACTKAAQWERAMAMLEEMKSAGVEPNRDTYNTLIALYAMCERGRWERALAVFEEMKAAVQPDVGTYDMLLSVLWLCGQRRTAIELYVEASKAGVYPLQDSLETLTLDFLPVGPALVATTLWLDAIAEAALRSPNAVPERLWVLPGHYEQLSTQSIHHVHEYSAFHATDDDDVIPLRCPAPDVAINPVTHFLQQLDSPFKVSRPPIRNGLVANRGAVCAWLAHLCPFIQHVCGDEQAASPGAKRVLARRAGRRARKQQQPSLAMRGERS